MILGRRFGLLGRQSFQLSYTQPIAAQLLCFHRILTMESKEVEMCVAGKHNLDTPFSISSEIAAVSSLRSNLAHILKSFPTSLAEDRHLLEESTSSRTSLAIRYRISVKELLNWQLEISAFLCQLASNSELESREWKGDVLSAINDYRSKLKIVPSQVTESQGYIRSSND